MNYTDAVENQRVLGQLVEREVYCNVSGLIADLITLIGNQNGRNATGLDEDLALELSQVPRDPVDVAEAHGYSFIEHNGDWYWFADTEPAPYRDVPTGHEIKKCPNAVLVTTASPQRTQIYPTKSAALRDEDLQTVEYTIEKAGLKFHDGYTDEFHDTMEEAIEAAWDTEGPASFDDKADAASDCLDENRIDLEYDEVYEHWVVSDFFRRKLEENGEKVVDVANLDVWCRTCTGQAISLDSVIGQIAADMKILPGMENSWADDK